MTKRARQLLAWLLALTALGLVFAAYARPELVLVLATQLWACF